jgi:hypothetical protein
MHTTIDPLEKLLEGTGTEDVLDDLGFPESLILIHLGAERYAAVNVTPDPQREPGWTINALAAFIDMEEATIFEMKHKLKGERINKTFREAREIAVSKENIQAIAIQRNGTTFQLHYVN